MAEERHAIRATLEDVLTNQKILFDLLCELVQAERPLRENERSKFDEYVARAFMGQGIGIKVSEKFRRISDSGLPVRAVVENAEDALRVMSLLTSNVFRDDEGNEYKISELWKEARWLALRVFPLAIKAAAAMSTEQWYRRGGVKPDKL